MFGDDDDIYFEKALDIADKYSLDELLSLLGIEEVDVIAALLECEFLTDEDLEELDDLKREA